MSKSASHCHKGCTRICAGLPRKQEQDGAFAEFCTRLVSEAGSRPPMLRAGPEHAQVRSPGQECGPGLGAKALRQDGAGRGLCWRYDSSRPATLSHHQCRQRSSVRCLTWPGASWRASRPPWQPRYKYLSKALPQDFSLLGRNCTLFYHRWHGPSASGLVQGRYAGEGSENCHQHFLDIAVCPI